MRRSTYGFCQGDRGAVFDFVDTQGSEASPLPPDHGRGLDQGDGIRPAAPQAGQQDPE